MKAEEAKTILEEHAKWLRGEGGQRANLSGAGLTRADLTGADLSGANLTAAYLSGAYLTRADLTRANLTGADLSAADFTRANLSAANLSGANLTRAYLSEADLSGADLSKATLPMLSILPEGDIVGWKRLRDGIIARLLIPANARRVNSTGRKCRAEYAEVLELIPTALAGWDQHTGQTRYAVGQVVRPDSYDPDFRVECSHGIHFFITRQEAEAY